MPFSNLLSKLLMLMLLILAQVLRLSEELVAGSILDDGCMSLVARGCSRLQELELVQV